MKGFIKSKKGLVLLATLVVAAAGAVAGYAFFTANGSGSGSATVGSPSSITISGTDTSALYPGYSVTFPVTVSNPGSGHQYIGTVSGSVTSANAGCTLSDFTFTPITINTDYAASASSVYTGTLAMTDAATSQNNCAGSSLGLSFSSN